jgi:hypothetical protein
MEPEGSLPCSQEPATGSYRQSYEFEAPLAQPPRWKTTTFRLSSNALQTCSRISVL